MSQAVTTPTTPDAPYPLPSTDEEHRRLQAIQHWLRPFFGKNVLVPISENPERILDIGTGSGLWAWEVATEYPQSRVVGIDIDPPQIKTPLPTNLEFRTENLLHGLIFPDNSVDLINSRWMVLAVHAKEWPFYLREIYHVLKAGSGWLQMIDWERTDVGHLYSYENSVPETPAIRKFAEYCSNFMTRMNFGFEKIEDIEKILQATGFVDITIERMHVPVGGWPTDPHLKEVGELGLPVMIPSIDNLGDAAMGPRPKMTLDERKSFYEEVKKDFANLEYKGEARQFGPMLPSNTNLRWLVKARKPSSKTSI